MSNIVLVHGGFVDGSGWQGVYQILRRSGHHVTVVQNPTTSLARRGRHQAGARSADRPSRAGRTLLRWRRHHRGRQPSPGVRWSTSPRSPPTGRIGEHPHRRPRAAHPAPPRWVPLPRQREVPRLLRGGRRPRPGRLHGRLAGALGSGRPGRGDHRTGLAEQAELVSHRHRGPHDPTGRPAVSWPAEPTPARSRPWAATPSTCPGPTWSPPSSTQPPTRSTEAGGGIWLWSPPVTIPPKRSSPNRNTRSWRSAFAGSRLIDCRSLSPHWLGYVSDAVSGQPIVCLIDDEQSLAKALVHALAFVARRLVGPSRSCPVEART